MVARVSLSYFPVEGTDDDAEAGVGLLAVQGFAITPGKATREQVTFSLLENDPPYRELRRFQSVPVAQAKAWRAYLIARYIRKVPAYMLRRPRLARHQHPDYEPAHPSQRPDAYRVVMRAKERKGRGARDGPTSAA